MEFVLIAASLATLAGLAGIIYPFRPFGKRRNALFTVVASIIAVGVASPSQDVTEAIASNSNGTTSLADAVQRHLDEADANEAKVEENEAEVDRVVDEAAVEERRKKVADGRRDLILEKAGILQWKEAKRLFTRFESDGLGDEDFKAYLEAKVLEMVKPLPASARETNLEGYELLAAIRPDNKEYAGKIKTYKEAIVAARSRAVSLLRKNVDKVEGITWYQHPNKPRYTNSRSTAYMYIGKKGDAGRPWLRLKVIYTANTWLFVNKVTAWHDGIKEPLISGRFERDNNSSIWEWMDVTPDDYQIEVLRSLANAQEAILRYEGDQYRKDVTLSAGDKKAIREVLEAYEVMRSGM